MTALVYWSRAPATNIKVKITTTDPTPIAGNATYPVQVPWFVVTEITGGTPTLTIAIYDGTTSFYLRNAQAVTAKQQIIFNEGILLEAGQYLRITSSAANQIDVFGMQTIPNASA